LHREVQLREAKDKEGKVRESANARFGKEFEELFRNPLESRGRCGLGSSDSRTLTDPTTKLYSKNAQSAAMR